MRFPLPYGTWRLSSPYGAERAAGPHKGTDLAAPTGTPVFSVSSGRVTRADKSNSYGNVVVINHGGSISTLYAHMNEILVQKGQRVKEGKEIGKVGSTGHSTGPHLHFEGINTAASPGGSQFYSQLNKFNPAKLPDVIINRLVIMAGIVIIIGGLIIIFQYISKKNGR